MKDLIFSFLIAIGLVIIIKQNLAIGIGLLLVIFPILIKINILDKDLTTLLEIFTERGRYMVELINEIKEIKND